MELYRDPVTIPVGSYRDPVNSYNIKTASSPESRLASDFLKINSPLVTFAGEPMLQAVRNPYQEIEPKPEEEPSPNSYSGSDIISEDSFVSVDEDVDDPFEPEAEVDLEVDFLPSVNPLSQVSPLSSHPLQTGFISQSLELLPPSFLAGVRRQRQFEDQVADLREDSISQDLQFQTLSNNHKRENIQEIQFPKSQEDILTDASLNRDKILAYNTYKNQWTTSGDKKLVVDASKALHNYYRKHNLEERQTAREHNGFDIDLSGPYQPERDNQVKKTSLSPLISPGHYF